MHRDGLHRLGGDLICGVAHDVQIAVELAVADGTVKRHVEDILTKLGLKTRAQLAVWAVQNLNAPPEPAAPVRFPGAPPPPDAGFPDG